MFCWFSPWSGTSGDQQSPSEGAGRAAGPCSWQHGRGAKLVPAQISAVASLSTIDGGSALLMDELYSPGEGRELFDLIHERRVPADEQESYRTMQQMEVIRYFHPTFFCLWGIQPFQDHNDSQKGHSEAGGGGGGKTIMHRNVNWKGCFSSWLRKAVQRSLKATTCIQLFYIILFLGKQNRIFPPSAIKISFTFHMQPAKFSFRVSASSFMLWEDSFSFMSLLQAPCSLLPAFSQPHWDLVCN